jgi:L-iditol 2-dehydrogenase
VSIHHFRAAPFKAPGLLEIRKVEASSLGEGELRVRVRACGICGSDLNIFRRDPPIPMFWGGHEISGVVEEVGSGVDGARVGERVSVFPLIACKTCEMCKEGFPNICPNTLFISFNLAGGFAEYVTVPEANLFTLPEALGFDEASLIEPVACAFHAMGVAGSVEGKTVIVVGAGTIGLLTVVMAKRFGAAKVVVTGKYEHQRELALRLGADVAIATEADIKVEISKAAGKADIVFETVGGYDSSTITDAIEILRPGGIIVLSGVHYKTPQMNLKNLTEKELQLRGTQRYKQEDFERAVAFAGDNSDALSTLITHKVCLDDIMKGFDIGFNKDKNKAVKVVVNP